MNQLVTEAVRMSQIDAGKVRLERQPLDVAEFLPPVVEQFESQAAGRSLRVNASPNLPHVSADPELLSLALRQLIDNALKYSPPGSYHHGGSGRDRVVIASGSRRVFRNASATHFDKFYRAAMRRGRGRACRGPGWASTSRGKSFARGGDLWIESEARNGSNSAPVFLYSAPLQGRANQMSSGRILVVDDERRSAACARHVDRTWL